METMLYNKINSTIDHWYAHLIVGIVLVIAGVWTVAAPTASYLALAFLFALTFLIAGVAEIIFSVTNRSKIDYWGWFLAGGIFSTALGILLLAYPAVPIVALPFYVGFFVMLRSINAIGTSIDLKNFGVNDWGLLMLLGILGLLFSFVLFWNPFFAENTIVIFTSLAFLISGFYTIYFSFKLKRLKDYPNRVSKELADRYDKLCREIQRELHV